MNENPWCRLPANPPYVLPDDEPDVGAFNDRVGPSRFLHIDKILPEAFVGAKDAPVVLLSNNPGFREESVPYKKNPVFVARMRTNLLHGPSEYPFVFLAPDISGPRKQWWRSKLKELLEEFENQVVARSILNVVYFPYPSQKYGHGRLKLPSQAYSFRLVGEAVKRKAVIVRMRKNERWFEKVSGLKEHDRLYQVNNWQNPAISRKNCDGFDEIVQAIRAAEAKRQES